MRKKYGVTKPNKYIYFSNGKDWGIGKEEHWDLGYRPNCNCIKVLDEWREKEIENILGKKI